jgi:hypothetical protein
MQTVHRNFIRNPEDLVGDYHFLYTASLTLGSHVRLQVQER